MRKLFFVLVVMLQVTIAYANDSTNEIKIPKNYKIKGSFSGELKGSDSFHIIVAQDKGKRDFELFLYKYSNKKIEELNKISYSNQPSILSFHNLDDKLVLLISFKNKFKDYFNVIDVNTNTGSYSKSDDILNEDLIATFRNENETVLLNGTKKVLEVTKVVNSKSISKLQADKNQYTKKIYFDYFKLGLDEVNQNEFVTYGSTRDVKGYYIDNKLIFTKDIAKMKGSSKQMYTNILEFNLDNQSLSEEIIKGSLLKRITEENSYLFKDLLFQIAINKREGEVSISNINTNKLLNKIDITSLESNVLSTGKDFLSLEDYLKKSNKGAYVSTITVNELSDRNYLLRLDYVSSTYNYNYNWWWWHHHMFMMQQQQMQMMRMSAPTGFGPNNLEYYYSFNSLLVEEDHSFEVVINKEGKIISKENKTTIFKKINKKNYVDDLNEENKKHSSSCFVDNAFRHIYYDKKMKSFKIHDKLIL